MLDRKVKFMPEDRKPTRYDFLRAAAHDPRVHACLMLHEHGHLTWEEMLVMAVLCQTDAYNQVFQDLLDLSMRTGPVGFVVQGKKEGS